MMGHSSSSLWQVAASLEVKSFINGMSCSDEMWGKGEICQSQGGFSSAKDRNGWSSCQSERGLGVGCGTPPCKPIGRGEDEIEIK